MALFIVRDNILNMDVDAIVNSTREELTGGGRADAAIHAAAGPGMDEECRKIGHCAVGQAVITGGYKLRSRYVIHTVGPVWKGGQYHEEEALKSCYRQSLLLADRHFCRSIAIPLISAGIHGYPKEKALQLATDVIREFLDTSDMEIFLVVFDRKAYQISQKLFDDVKAYIDDNYVDSIHQSYGMFAGTSMQEPYSVQADMSECSPQYSEPLPGAAAPRPHLSAKRDSAAGPKKKAVRKKKKFPELFSLKKRDLKLDESFSECLLRMIDERGLSDSECYKKANIDRKLFSKIRSNAYYNPSKPTALAFAVALELDYAETQEFLKKAGFTLSRSQLLDVIVEYFIRNGRYDIYEINEVLFAYDQKLLGAASK